MKKTLTVTSSIFLIALFFALSAFTDFSDVNDNFKYIGVTKCAGACHKTEAQGKQLEIWQNSKHSQAWKTLETPEADKIATDKGFTTKAAETPECIKCHVLQGPLNAGDLTETFDKTQGVQCESCHGPGSEYKAMSIMKDRQKAIDNGLIIHSDKDAFCTGCHNSESPTFKGFKYDEMWSQIAHPKPGK